MEPQVQPSNVDQDIVDIDLSDITLDDLDQLDDSVLTHALRRFQREATNGPDGAVAHNSTTHNSGHSSSPW